MFVCSINFASADEAEVCGGTFQSFWQIEQSTKLLQLKAFYRHPETQFCEKSMTASPNAEIQMLDNSKNLIRKFKAYLPLESFQDRKINGRQFGTISHPRAQIIQIKFADDVIFKKVKFIKITFSDGSFYGPSSL